MALGVVSFGMPTLIETSAIEECAVLCAESGLDFIELNMNMPQYQLDRIDVEYFKRVADKYGIYYTIHLDENLNVSDFNPYIAEAYTKTVADTIEIAKQRPFCELSAYGKIVYEAIGNIEKKYPRDKGRQICYNARPYSSAAFNSA